MDLVEVITQAGRSGASQIRIGTVVAFTTGTITINVGGSNLPAMPYLRAYRPLIGDTVTVLGSGPTWVCLGAVTGSPPGNLVTNPQFDGGTTGWTLNVVNGTGGVPAMSAASIEANFPGEQVDGATALQLSVFTLGGDSEAYAYSQPFRVQPGRSYAVAATVRGLADGSANNINTGVYAAIGWYPDAVTTTPSSTVTSALSVMPQQYGWRTLVCGNAGVQTPAGATFARVHLGMEVEDFGGGNAVNAYFDLAIARLIG